MQKNQVISSCGVQVSLVVGKSIEIHRPWHHGPFIPECTGQILGWLGRDQTFIRQEGHFVQLITESLFHGGDLLQSIRLGYIWEISP